LRNLRIPKFGRYTHLRCSLAGMQPSSLAVAATEQMTEAIVPKRPPSRYRADKPAMVSVFAMIGFAVISERGANSTIWRGTTPPRSEALQLLRSY
jgi:hypothetical protein